MENLLRLMLRPVLWLALRHAVKIPELVEQLKAEFIRLAELELNNREEKVTVSRISVMTGLHRGDVKRLRSKEDIYEPTQSLVARVIGTWEQDPRFATKRGGARVLSYVGEDSEFAQLVAPLCTGVGPAAMLFELERLGVVEKTKSGVRLVKNVHEQLSPKEGFDLIGRDIETLIRAGEENLLKPQEVRNLHARTEYDNLYDDEIPKIRKWLLERGREFHREVRNYLSQFDKDINPDPKRKGGRRVAVGTFSYVIPEGEEE